MLLVELFSQFINRIISLFFILMIINCNNDIKRPSLLLSLLQSKGILGIITSDYSGSGRFLTLNEGSQLSLNYLSIHSDAVGFYLENKIYIVNRLNRDSIQVLNPEFFNLTTMEFSTGNGTNPHGIAIYKNKAYITLYEKNYILVVDLNNGTQIKRIDLSPYTDTQSFLPSPDGIPEASGIVALNNKIYVALQRLDRTDVNMIFPVTDYSLLLEIDPESDQVTRSIRWIYKNPVSKLKIYNITGEDCIFVANGGNLGFNFAIDGGIEGYCPTSQIQFSILHESAVKGDLLDFVILDSTTAFASVLYADFSSSIFEFNPLTGNIKKEIIFYKNQIFSAGLEIYDNHLYIGENSRYPLIRVYNINSGTFTNIIPLEQNPFDIFLLK